MPVRTGPGRTAFTRTRAGANSTASARLRLSTAPVTAAGTEVPGPGLVATVPEVNVIDPPGRIRPAACLAAQNAPQYRVSKNARAAAGSRSLTGPSSSGSPAV